MPGVQTGEGGYPPQRLVTSSIRGLQPGATKSGVFRSLILLAISVIEQQSTSKGMRLTIHRRSPTEPLVLPIRYPDPLA